MAELAARKLKPSKGFAALADYTSFDTEAKRIKRMTTDEMRDLDLAKWERTVFYPFGSIEGLVLDNVDPTWRTRYFSDKFALEKFYGNRTTSR